MMKTAIQNSPLKKNTERDASYLFNSIESKRTEDTLIESPSLFDEEPDDGDRFSPTSVIENREKKALENLSNDKQIQTLMQSVGDGSARQQLEELLATARTQMNADNHTIRSLVTSTNKFKSEVASIKASKAKTIQNMRAKIATLQTAETELDQAKKEVAQLQLTQKRLEEQNLKLRNGIQNLTSSRDDVKIKLMNLKEVNKELRQCKTDGERKIAKMERDSKTTEELLKTYRELAIHTGYHHFGKQIRMLESSLAACNE